MHASALLTSALAIGALALPQGQLDKRQQVVVTRTVTVTTTVTANAGNPTSTRAGGWAGPPQVSNPPRPSNAPPPFSPNIPSPDAGRPSSTRVNAPPSTTSRSSTSRSSTRTSSRTPSSTTSRSSTRPANTGAPLPGVSSTTSRSSTRPANTGAPLPGVSSSSTSRPISSTVIGAPISNSAVPSSVVPPRPSAPLDPGHASGTAQAFLKVSDGAAYRNAILYHHNAARDNHGAAPLVWNDTVATTAQWTAETCNFAHSFPPGTRGQGQNLFTTSGPNFNVTAGITESWYKDEFPPMVPYFGQASIPSNVFPQVGHLTQVLWKGTTSVGCYSLDCSGRMTVGSNANSALNKYTVCNYYPAGNVGTQFAINVGRPESSTDLGSWTD